MSNAILYAANTSTQTIAANGVINFGNIVRKCGCDCTISGGNPYVKGSGYYNVDTNIDFTATSTLTTIRLMLDGVAIPGATIVRTTAVGNQYTASIPAVVRSRCCGGTITAVIVEGATVTNAAIVVEKV